MREVSVSVADGVATVRLEAAARRNALALPMVEELIAAFDRLEAGEEGYVGAVIVTGAPPAFCAGADLSQLGDSQEEGLRDIYEGFLRVGRSPLPTIAAVNGAAVGAGMNLALCCDLRLAGRSARFDTRFLQLGLHPGGGHTWMLDRIVGPQTAAAMVLFGEILDGEAAAAAGLVWRCFDDGELLPAATALAARAAAAPLELAMRVKSTLRSIRSAASHDAAVDVEIGPQLWSLEQPAFQERLAALQAKIQQRTPSAE